MVPVEQLPERVDVAVLRRTDQRPAVGDLLVRLLEAGALQVGRVDLGRLVVGPHVLHDRDHGLVDPGGLDRRRRWVHPVGGGHRAGRRTDGRMAGRRRARRCQREGARGRERARGRRGSRGWWGRRHRAGRTRRGGRRRAPALHPRQVGVRGVVDGPRARGRPTGVGAALLGVGRPVPLLGRTRGPAPRHGVARLRRGVGHGRGPAGPVASVAPRLRRPAGADRHRAPSVVAAATASSERTGTTGSGAREARVGAGASGRIAAGAAPGVTPAPTTADKAFSLAGRPLGSGRADPSARAIGEHAATEHTCGSEALVTGAPPTRTRLVDMHLTCGERS